MWGIIIIIKIYLADVAAGEFVGEGVEEEEALVLAGQLVGGVDLHVAAAAERSLVRAAYHRRRRLLAHVALDLHPQSLPYSLLLPSPPLLSLFATSIFTTNHTTAFFPNWSSKLIKKRESDQTNRSEREREREMGEEAKAKKRDQEKGGDWLPKWGRNGEG